MEIRHVTGNQIISTIDIDNGPVLTPSFEHDGVVISTLDFVKVDELKENPDMMGLRERALLKPEQEVKVVPFNLQPAQLIARYKRLHPHHQGDFHESLTDE